MKNNKKTVMLYLAPAILTIVVFLYLPIIINFVNSFYDWGALTTKREFVGLANYTRMFGDDVFYTAVKNNLVFVIASIICQIGVSLLIAAALESKFLRKAQGVFRTIYFIPSLLMVTVTGITFKMLYSPTTGIVNPLLERLGFDISRLDILGNAQTAIYGVTAASQWQYIGYTVVLFIVAMQNIPEDLYEAADIDGASAAQKFFKVTIPQMKDTILVNMIIIVTGAIRIYDEIYVMTSGGPGTATETLATLLYRSGFKNDEMGYASAIAFFIFIVTFGLGLLQMRGYQLEEE